MNKETMIMLEDKMFIKDMNCRPSPKGEG